MGETIKTKVTDQGVLIPREFLEGVEEVEIHKENNTIVITPASQQDPTAATAGAWKDLLDCRTFEDEVYESRLRRMRPEIRL